MRPVFTPNAQTNFPPKKESVKTAGKPKLKEDSRVSVRLDRGPRPSRANPPTRMLKQEDCGRLWTEVLDSLRNAPGLSIENTSIIAASGLRNEALPEVANAIGLLVEAGNLEAAWKLMVLCRPSMILLVLHGCSAQHVAKLVADDHPKVAEARCSVMNPALAQALRRGNFSPVYKLLPLYSPATKPELLGLIPPLTLETVRELDPSVLCDALIFEFKRTPEADVEAVERLRKLALQSGNLVAAAGLDKCSPDRMFRRALLQAIHDNLAEAGFAVTQEPFAFNFRTINLADRVTEAAGTQYANIILAQKMAHAFHLIGESHRALKILAKIGAEPALERDVILGVLFLEFGVSLPTSRDAIAMVLPRLCLPKNIFLLDLIAETGEGRKLLGPALVDFLSKGDCSPSVIEVLVTLSDRVPIKDALPEILSTLTWAWSPTGQAIQGVEPGPPLTAMLHIAEELKKLYAIPPPSPSGFSPGWGPLLLIAQEQKLSRYDSKNTPRLIAARLFENAATGEDASMLAALSLSTRIKVLSDLINAQLLSGNALSNVFLALIDTSDENLLIQTLGALEDSGWAEWVRVAYTALAHALVELPEGRRSDTTVTLAAKHLLRSRYAEEVKVALAPFYDDGWGQLTLRYPGN